MVVALMRKGVANLRLRVAMMRKGVASQQMHAALQPLLVAFQRLCVALQPLSVPELRLRVPLQPLFVASQPAVVAEGPLRAPSHRWPPPGSGGLSGFPSRAEASGSPARATRPAEFKEQGGLAVDWTAYRPKLGIFRSIAF
jgi:hypothetical protein